jgi:hypothetical protein
MAADEGIYSISEDLNPRSVHWRLGTQCGRVVMERAPVAKRPPRAMSAVSAARGPLTL